MGSTVVHKDRDENEQWSGTLSIGRKAVYEKLAADDFFGDP